MINKNIALHAHLLYFPDVPLYLRWNSNSLLDHLCDQTRTGFHCDSDASRAKKFVDFPWSHHFRGLEGIWDEDLKANNLLKWKYKEGERKGAMYAKRLSLKHKPHD